MRLVSIAATTALIFMATGCGDEQIRIRKTHCAFGPEHQLSTIEGLLIHDLALRRTASRIWALWSDRSGLYASELDSEGAAINHPMRVSRACEGGLAVAAHEDVLWVACGRRGDAARVDTGGVQLLSIRGGGVRAEGAFGALGASGEGVALAVSPHGTIAIGWQEDHTSISHSWIQALTPGALPERLSDSRFFGSRPSLEWQGERLASTWSETWFDARGRSEGRIMLRIGERASRAAETNIENSLPTLRSGMANELLLTFRDRLQTRTRPRVRIGRVEGDGTLARLEDGSSANAAGESIAIGCGRDVFVIAPRSRSRAERLVGVRRYFPDLEPHGPELQLYEHGVAYEHADAQCIDDHLVILYGSRPTHILPTGNMRAVSLTCDSSE